MFTTPFLILTVPVSNTAVIHHCELAYTYGGTAFTAGGTMFLQYGAGSGATGIRCSGTLGNATGVTQNSVSIAGQSAFTMQNRVSIEQTFVTLSNDTAAYATGTGSFILKIWFSFITL